MFDELIRDKRVVFVGPSATLIGRNRKDFINSFDVVVKTNGLGFIKPDLYDDYGDRCDILYVNQSFLDYADMNVEHLLSIGVKIICAKAHNKIKKLNLDPIHVRIMRRLRDNHFSCSPIMGSLILNDIMEANPKRLHLMGMDFYKGEIPYVPTYQPKAIEDIIQKRIKRKGHFGTNQKNSKKPIHMVKEDFAYIFGRYKATKKITVDKHMKKLFDDYEAENEEV